MQLRGAKIHMYMNSLKRDVFTIPNILSMIRLMIIPVYIAMYLNAKDIIDYHITAGILSASCLTDLIDGKIARHYNMVSSLGKVLDPIADKITQFTLIICLAIRKNMLILWILIALFVIKEMFQLVAGSIMLKKGKMLSGALMAGKVCTAVLFVSMIIMVILPNLPRQALFLIAFLDGFFLLASFFSYILVYSGRPELVQNLYNKPE